MRITHAALLACTAALASVATFVAAPARAAEPVPEITRGAVAPQAIGAAHTLRQIPEACARGWQLALVRATANR